MKAVTIILLVLISTVTVFAQEIDYISTQRPGYSENASPLVRKTIQIETGYDYFSEDGMFSTVARYAPFKNFETRISTGWEKNTTVVGVKYNILINDKLPTFAVLVDITENFNFNHVLLSSSYNFTDNIGLTVNYGRYLDYNIGTINLGYAISTKVFTYIESYFERDIVQGNLGVGYFITPDILVDGSIGIAEGGAHYYGVGTAFRFRHK